MGGKSSQSTQQIQIPPEVLARYNAVNARAETVADRPFQQYSTDPNAFVAPLTATQQAGIAGTSQYAQTAQPYYQAATQQLGGAQSTALPFYGQAARQTAQAQDIGSRMAGLSAQTLGGAQDVGSRLANLSYESLYGGQQAAQTPQQQAYGAYNQAYSGAQPYQAAATGLTLAGAQGVNPGELGPQQINQYMSPYLANVLQGTAALQNQMNQQAMSGQTGNAIRQGAFGGDRAGIAAANLAQQQQLANAKTFSDILNQGYGQGLATAQQQQQLGLSAAQANRAALQQAGQQLLGVGQQGFQQGLGYGQAQQGLGQQLFGQGATSAQQLANLGQQQFGQGLSAAQQQAALGQQQFAQGLGAAQQNAALGAGLYGMGSQTAQQLAALGVGSQSAGLQGAQAQLAAGQAEQQTEQAGKQALYNQFLQQQSYPFQVAQFLANIAMGTGALSGSTTQTNQMLSDKRLKENIKPVGKTFDGQTIYSYNFKGEPQTEIGLIAQEVQKHHPEAVGLAGGYRTVNYDKATEDAADRGHFAAGGAAMGGGVMPYHAGEGFYDGGFVGYDPGIMQQILSSYERMYAPLQGAKGGLGAASFVPESNLPVGQLQTAGALPDAGPSALDSAKGMVSLGTGLGELGGNLGAWDYTDAQRDKTAKKKQDRLDRLASPAGSTVDENAGIFARGGLAGGRHGYEDGGITVVGKKEKPEEEPEKVEVPSATPAAAPLAPVAKIDAARTVEKPSFQKVGLDIPQVANTVGLTPAAALTPLKDSTGDILSGIGKIGSAAAALGLSDKRLKENIKAVGKTFDGQTVYSYNYKGDHQTRMGLIAQEVAKHHPQAVGHAGNYKTVDYKKATSGAAHRGHFAIGGEADDGTMGAPGLNIPTEGNKIGLAAAPGLSPLKDSTGDILKGLGGIGDAASKIMKKAIGGEIEDAGLSPISGIERSLDPMNHINDIISGSVKLEDLMGTPVAEKVKIMERPVMAARRAKPGLAAASMPDKVEESFTADGPLPSDISTIARMIRGHEGLGQNPRSSALGPYQMIDSTFVNYFRKMFPDQAQGKSDRDILSIRRSPMGTSVSEQIGPQIIRDNARIIASRGFEPNARNIYLAHFFGPQTAVRVLSADPSTPIERIVGQDAVDANPFLRGKDAMGALEFAENAMARQHRMLAAPGKAEGGFLDGESYGDFANDEEPRAPSGLAGGEAPVPATSAPPTPAATEASAKPKTRGLFSEIAHGDFVSGLGKGRATSWIPLLTGIGASMSGPYRGLVGIGQGLAAGAQAAQAQREFGRQQQETGIRATQAETQRMQIPISQQVADAQLLAARTGNTNSLEAMRNERIKNLAIMRTMGKATTDNPAYQQVQLELQAIEKAISDIQKLGVQSVSGDRDFLGDVSGALTDAQKAQQLAMGLQISGIPGGEVPAGVANAARDQGVIIDKNGNIVPAPGFAETKTITATTQQAGEQATEANKQAYLDIQRDWHEIKSKVVPVLEQLPDNLPETGLGGQALSNLASAVRVLGSTQGVDLSGINGSDPRSVITAAGQMLGIPVSADNPTASVNAVVRALKARVWQISNAARATGEWAKQNIDPVTGMPRYNRGNVTEIITKAMGQ